jgi:hypothetical protein
MPMKPRQLSALVTLSLIAAGVVASSCAAVSQTPPRCLTDTDCGDQLICFPDGCGDPTRGLAVEITGGSTFGLFPQDFEIAQLGTTQDFEIKGALTIVGSFQRERTAGVDPSQRSIYTDEVVVRASGESTVLPGLARNYQARFAMTDRGTFSMNVGQGTFTVTASPVSLEVPPQTFSNISVSPDTGATVNFAFASVEGASTLAGRLIRKRVTVPVPAELYITQDAMDLQAFDPATGDPLSQRVETSTGRPGARGDFILVLSPQANQLPAIELVASAREAGALVPTRRFLLPRPFLSNLTLELGDFGEPIRMVPGQVLGSDGQPLSGATVILEGRVSGGSTFRSQPATTDTDGRFMLDLLPPDQRFTLTVFPRPGARSAVTQQQVKVQNAPGSTPSLDPPTVRCNERILVSGEVRLPDGVPAPLIAVRAIETSLGTRALPLDDVDGLTDLDGKYQLALDAGNWRLEFIPSVQLPQASRLITVSAAAATSSGSMGLSQTFAPITLPRGRRLTGTVTSTLSTNGPQPLVNAQVRFFRVTRIEGKPAAVALGAGITNGSGTYSVILPTREPAQR